MDEIKIEYIPIDELTVYERNARKHAEADIAAIEESIKQFGFNDPIGIWGDKKIIVEGHGRLIAAKRQGFTELPCIRLDHLTDEQRRGYALAHNKTAENSEWDMPILTEELRDLEKYFDMAEFGFDALLDTAEPVEVVEDEAPKEAPSRAKLGDIWQLGEHRLMCGDSTDAETVAKLMNGAKAKLLLQDPPYGIDVVKNRQVGGGGALHFGGKVGKRVESSTYIPIANDDTTDTAKANYDIALTCTENQIIFGGNYFTDFLPPSRCWIVWDKQNTGYFADAELAYTSFGKGVRLYHFLWNGLCREGSREVEGKTRVHPTQKPVGMLADILKDFSDENDSILDCFGGSGSTLIACEQLNRKCYMMELDPHYVDVIIARWEQFTGGEAVLLNG